MPLELLTFAVFLNLAASQSSSQSSKDQQLETCRRWLANFILNSTHPDCYCYKECQELPTSDDGLGQGPMTSKRNQSLEPPLMVIPSPANSDRAIANALMRDQCRCDDLCAEFRDCCVANPLLCSQVTASKHAGKSATLPTKVLRSWECVNPTLSLQTLEKPLSMEEHHAGFYMVTTCASDWSDSNMLEACQDYDHGRNVSNMIHITPVTASNVTYRNAYCAYCNHLTNVTDYIYWNPKLKCNNTIISMINSTIDSHSDDVLDAVSQQCGIEDFDPPNNRRESPVAINHNLAVRTCMAVESECLPFDEFKSLTNLSESEYDCLQLSCDGHTEYMRAGNRYFKNRFCAVCNGFNLSEVNCLIDSAEGYSEIEYAHGNHVIMLMDFTGSGQVALHSEETKNIIISYSCPINQVYDTHSKHCRQLTCLGSSTCPTNGPWMPDTVITFNLLFKANISGNIMNSSFLDHQFSDEFRATLSHLLQSSLNSTITSLNFTGKPGSRVFVIATIPQTGLGVNLTNIDLGKFSVKGVTFTHLPTATSSELHLSCHLVTLNATEFVSLTNGTVVEEESGLKWNSNEYVLLSDGRMRRCNSYSRNYTTMETRVVWDYNKPVVILSLVGSILNILSCSVVLLTYACFKSLRTLPGLNLMNLVAAILLSHLILITGAGQVDDTDVCTAVAFLLHFFFLSSFTWSNVVAFDMLQTFVLNRRKSHLTAVSAKQTITKYSMYGWGMPLLICLLCLLLDELSFVDIGYGNQSVCWIGNSTALIAVFIAPVLFTLLFNMAVFVLLARAVHLSLKHSFKLVGLKGRQSEKKRRVSSSSNTPLQPETSKKLKREISILFSMFSLLSLTWMFALLAASEKSRFFWYPFVIFTALQGVFILLSYVLRKRVRKEYKHLFFKLQKQRQGTEYDQRHDTCVSQSTDL